MIEDDDSEVDEGLDLYSAQLHKVVAILRTALGDDRASLPWVPENLPDLYALAGLSHCCVLLDELDRLRKDEALFHGYLVARSVVESWLTASYIFFGRQKALDEIEGNFASSLRTQVENLRRTAKEEREQYKKLVRRRNNTIRDVERITAKNERDGTAISIPKVPSEPVAPHDVSVGTNILLASIVGITNLGVSYDTMAKRIGALAREAGAGGGNWSKLYDIVYRSLSNFGAHPSFYVLDSYIDPPTTDPVSSNRHVRTTTLRHGHVHNATMDVVQLVAMLGAELLEKLGFDVSELRSIGMWWSDIKVQINASR